MSSTLYGLFGIRHAECFRGVCVRAVPSVLPAAGASGCGRAAPSGRALRGFSRDLGEPQQPGIGQGMTSGHPDPIQERQRWVSARVKGADASLRDLRPLTRLVLCGVGVGEGVRAVDTDRLEAPAGDTRDQEALGTHSALSVP